MLFYVAALIVALACSTITIKTLVGYSSLKLIHKIIVSSIIIIGWFAPLIIGLFRFLPNLGAGVYDTIYYVSYTLFGFVFLLFVILMLRDVVWYILYGLAKIVGFGSWSINPKNLSLLGYANVIVVFTGVFLSLFALYGGMKTPEVKELNISSHRIAKELKVVQISDLHITRSTPMNSIYRLVNLVNAQNPDVVFMTGDIIDDKIASISQQLDALQALIAPYGVYAASGNHEFYNNIEDWIKKFQELGFTILLNKGLPISNTNIFVSGIPDMQTASAHPLYNVNFIKALKGSNPDNYKVLLSHNPDMVDNLTSITYSLQLSGHTHGGQIAPFHLLVKKANKYLSGSYKVNGVDLYVNRGAGTWGPMMRFLAPSEITVINFQPQK